MACFDAKRDKHLVRLLGAICRAVLGSARAAPCAWRRSCNGTAASYWLGINPCAWQWFFPHRGLSGWGMHNAGHELRAFAIAVPTSLQAGGACACCGGTQPVGAVVVARVCAVVPRAGSYWGCGAGAAHHGVCFDGRLGGYAQFSQAARLAVAACAVWPHAAKLGCWGVCQSCSQAQCGGYYGAVWRGAVEPVLPAHVGEGCGHSLYVGGVVLVVAPPGTCCTARTARA